MSCFCIKKDSLNKEPYDRNIHLIGFDNKDIYMDDKKKVTIRFTIGSNERTLEQAEIQEFKDSFIEFIEKTYSIVK